MLDRIGHRQTGGKTGDDLWSSISKGLPLVCPSWYYSFLCVSLLWKCFIFPMSPRAFFFFLSSPLTLTLYVSIYLVGRVMISLMRLLHFSNPLDYQINGAAFVYRHLWGDAYACSLSLHGLYSNHEYPITPVTSYYMEDKALLMGGDKGEKWQQRFSTNSRGVRSHGFLQNNW